jgi:hypothetical protein
VSRSPCAACGPSACTSVMKIASAAILNFFVNPNSCACLSELLVSLPPLASAITSAPDACACRRNDEKSDVLVGCRTEPATWPPWAFTMRETSASIACPNA